MVASLHGVLAAVIGVHGGVDKLMGSSGMFPVDDLTYVRKR